MGGGEIIAPSLTVVLDAITCFIIYLLARNLGIGRTVASLAALGWAVYLPEVSLVTRFWSEPLFTALLAGAMLCFVVALRQDGWWRFALVGGLFGLTTLCRPAAFPVPILMAIYLLIRMRSNLGKALRSGLVMVAVSLVMLAPWIVRNRLSLHAFVPLTTHGSYTLLLGNCTLDQPNYLREPPDEVARQKFRQWLAENHPDLEFTSEVERDALHRRYALELIREHPWRYVHLSAVRFARMWLNVGYGHSPSTKSWIVCVWNAALLLLAACGLWRLHRRAMIGIGPILLLIAYMTLLHMGIIAYVRFSFPLVPFALAVGAGVLTSQKESIRSTKKTL